MPLTIAIDGVNGCGKTTQLDLLHKLFASWGFTVIRSADIPDHPLSSVTREMLKTGDFQNSWVYLFATLRSINIEMVNAEVERLTSNGIPTKKIIVLQDRSILSSIAYQGANALKVNSLLPVPTVVVLMTPSTATVLDNLVSRGTEGDVFEKADGMHVSHWEKRFVEALEDYLLYLEGYGVNTTAFIMPVKRFVSAEENNKELIFLLNNYLRAMTGNVNPSLVEHLERYVEENCGK